MPMITDSSPIEFQDPLPDSVDVVVVGAGVVGMSTAWYLTQRGVSVLVCDKGRVACEQSSRNWGWVRQQGRDPAELPIMIDSINAWERLSSETGEDLGFARGGIVYLARNDDELNAMERWLETAQQHQLDTVMLPASGVDDLIPDTAGQWRGGMYTKSDGRAEPFYAVPRLARAARRLGCRIRERCAVRTVDVQAGRVCGVVTEHGRVPAQSVVCAAGVWSSLLAGHLGIRLPQLMVRASVARTGPAPELFAGGAAGGGIAFRRRADGGYTVSASDTNEHFAGFDSVRFMRDYMPALRSSSRFLQIRLGTLPLVSDSGADGPTHADRLRLIDRLRPRSRWSDDSISPFEHTRVLNPQPSAEATRLIRDRLPRRLPSLRGVPLVESWAGMIDVTPDVVPVMDQVAQLPGLFVATGFSGHGFGIGPGAGRVMAALVEGRPPDHDLTRFRLARFTDGTPMRPGPGL